MNDKPINMGRLLEIKSSNNAHNIISASLIGVPFEEECHSTGDETLVKVTDNDGLVLIIKCFARKKP